MLETTFTRLVGCTVPIQLAGMGSILSPELAAAVSNAGALGQMTFAGIEVEDARRRLDRLSLLTSKPFGVNLLIPYLDMKILEVAAAKARVIDFFWGDPDPELVSFVHDAGALASWQVGSTVEAIAAEAAGCDFIIAQAIEAADAFQGEYVAEIEFGGKRQQIARFRGVPPFKGFHGHIDAMACYAGQSVGDVKSIQPAAEIVADLVSDAERIIRASAWLPL